MIESNVHLLKSRVNAFVGSMLLASVGLWAGVTIWQAAHGTNPIATALASALERNLEITQP